MPLIDPDPNLEGFKKKKRIISLDLDGTLVEDATTIMDLSFRPIKGAREFTRKLKKDGFEIFIYTARPNTQAKEIRNALVKNGILFDHVICNKIIAHYYLDNRAIRFEGDYKKVLKKIKETIK